MFLLCFLERNGGFCLVGLLSREAGVLRHSQIIMKLAMSR